LTLFNDLRKNIVQIQKKIFATIDLKTKLVCEKLNAIDQASFCSFDKQIMYPVPNKWGQQGWTLINLENVLEDTLRNAQETSYKTVTGNG
jgi:hypothetical protein